MVEINRRKAGMLYDVIDRSDGFYLPHAETASRSIMNVPFKLADTSQEEAFLKGAAACGLVELKGHRSVGGFRASIYNAMPEAGVQPCGITCSISRRRTRALTGLDWDVQRLDLDVGRDDRRRILAFVNERAILAVALGLAEGRFRADQHRGRTVVVPPRVRRN